MLSALTIRNLALIDSLSLDLQSGMTVLTGETGAGKSILIDAISLVLGDRADASIVRTGADQAEVVAAFMLPLESSAQAWLQEQAIASADELLLRRVVSREGRSRAFVNGTSVTLAQLKDIGSRLIDIHGQHEHQRLLQSPVQRELLDAYAQHASQVVAVREAAAKWQQLQHEYQRLRAAQRDRAAQLDLLQFQVAELDEANAAGLDIAALEQQHRQVAHAAEMILLAQQAAALLDGEDEQDAASSIESALERLQRIAHIDATQTARCSELVGALTVVQELASDLKHYAEKMDVDEGELAELDQQIAALHRLARKHRVDMQELPDLYRQLTKELDDLTHGSERLDALETALAQARKHYELCSRELTSSRQQAAQRMAVDVAQYLAQLGMSGGRFVAQLSARDIDEIHADGAEKIEFLVAANAGSPPRPLAKVASGGELSRISLAIQVINAQSSDLPCMIFDEIDVGVGGATAEIVGRLLRQLAANAQVLCVTHQAQVAALAHQHWRVQKSSDGETTRTDVAMLGKKERVDEIARMVGGLTITDKTRSHAREMLSQAQ